MRRRQLLVASGATFSALVAGCLGSNDVPGPEPPTGNHRSDGARSIDAGDWPSGPYADYETTEVTLWTPEGELLGAVYAAIATSRSEQYLGLSAAPTLPPDAAMIFIYSSVSNRTFVMREMDFAIDIIYADGDGRITRIHHAPAPAPDEDGNDQRYPGQGQYVLETNYRWSTQHDVSVGDYLAFER